jgi:hypothetical protein
MTTPANYILGGLSFSGVKILRLTIGVVIYNGGFLFVPLLKGDCTFSRAKIQDVIIMVILDDDGLCALLPS